MYRSLDFSEQIFPNAIFFKNTISAYRTLPLWNPHIFSGFPFIADPQNLMNYLPNWLIIFLPVNLGLTIVLIFHILLALIGVFIILKRFLRLGSLSSLIGGFIYCFSPFFLAEVFDGHYNMYLAFSLVPLSWLFLARIMEKPSFKNISFLGLILAGIYFNYLTIFYYLSLAVFLFVLYQSIVKRKIWPLVHLIISLAITFGLSSYAILPQLELADYSSRKLLTYQEMALPVFSLKLFFQASVFPFSIGISRIPAGTYLYPGIIVLMLAAFGLLKIKRQKRWLILGVIFLLIGISLGSRIPLYPWLYKFLPAMKYMRITTRIWFLNIFLISILAARGIDFLNKKSQKITLFIILLLILEYLTVNALRIQPYFKPETDGQTKELVGFLKKDPELFRFYCTDYCLSQTEIVKNNLYATGGYSASHLLNYLEFLEKAGGFDFGNFSGFWPPYQVFLAKKAQPQSLFLAKLNVKYVISDYELEDKNLNLERRIGNDFIYKNNNILPRVYAEEEHRITEIPVKEYTPNYLVLETMNRKGEIVVGEIWYPGWKAVDEEGRNLSVYQKDIFRAVKLTGRSKTVKMYYFPEAFYKGLVISLGSLAIISLIIVLEKKKL